MKNMVTWRHGDIDFGCLSVLVCERDTACTTSHAAIQTKEMVLQWENTLLLCSRTKALSQFWNACRHVTMSPCRHVFHLPVTTSESRHTPRGRYRHECTLNGQIIYSPRVGVPYTIRYMSVLVTLRDPPLFEAFTWRLKSWWHGDMVTCILDARMWVRYCVYNISQSKYIQTSESCNARIILFCGRTRSFSIFWKVMSPCHHVAMSPWFSSPATAKIVYSPRVGSPSTIHYMSVLVTLSNPPLFEAFTWRLKTWIMVTWRHGDMDFGCSYVGAVLRVRHLKE